MCVAVPGKVVAVNGDMAQVDFKGNLVPVNTGLVDPKVGDYVLVHAGCAIEVMEKDKAEEIIELFMELEEVMG
ncbi:MAG: HypC/HybG/HupF family hydrogenase formation chaperone [Firmicutes bacterium]|nr:HypC/HybG/HupF family hydrogenase formation chaperone [Bacillota bacterium]MBQ3123080.1 HypC/HybG/HupF family hydrogenase formation chaperone [Bacillota bacterium]MBQ9972549.1 HypC/HybG/HupF family hydrogenase formation chaperone [Bacillota bacterium]